MQITANYNANSNPNFQSLKGVEIIGKEIKRNPDLAKKVLENVKLNRDIMSFCDRWDTNIILSSSNTSVGHSMLGIVFAYKEKENKDASFISRLLHRLLNKEKTYDWCNWGNNISGATDSLIENINNIAYNLTSITNEADKKLFDKEQIKQQKIADREKRYSDKARKNNDQFELEKLINDMTSNQK